MKYAELSEIYDSLEKTSKRLEKTHIISKLLKKTDEEDIEEIILLLQGKVFPLWDDTKLGVSEKLVIKAIGIASGNSPEKIETEWKKIGDLGLVAEKLLAKKSQSTLFSKDLTVKKVFNNIKALPALEGTGSVDQKVKNIAELLSNAKAKEAIYIVRTVLEDMRVGVGVSSLRDAIVWAFFEKEASIHYDDEKKSITPENREEYNKLIDATQAAFDLKADFTEIAHLIKKKGTAAFSELTLKPGSPLSVMLYPKAKNIENAFEIVGKPCAFEYKYDGFRIQIHKSAGKIKIFTRRLEEVTAQFPEIAIYADEYIRGDSFIVDAEAVGFEEKTGKYLPFQAISQRIRRKYDIEQTAKEFPVEVHVFDVIYYEGKSMLTVPFKERRAFIEKIIKEHKKKLVLAKQLITDDLKKAEAFYKEALAAGEEGVMAKNLDGAYQPGRRTGFGVKVKPVMEPLDLVIVGAEWGTGKRSGWLTSFVLACRDDDEFLEIGRVGTGIKELEEEGVSFEEITNRLKPHILSEKGKEVMLKPNLIIEVNYEEIQKSPTYSSGFALRFPRFIRIRDDKSLREVSDMGFIEKLYREQG